MGVEDGFKEIKQQEIKEELNIGDNNEQLIARIEEIQKGLTKAREARKLGKQDSGISLEKEQEFTKKLEEAYTIGLDLFKNK